MADATILIWVALAILAVAFLYSSVGHAGASGYIAVLALAGYAPLIIKPTALVLNILVAAIGSFQFWRAGHFRWNLFWPFALLAAPAAFLGGYLHLPTQIFKLLIGVVLLCSALRFFFRPGDPSATKPPRLTVSLGAGAGLGLLSGLTGTGGGIFLTPLMLLCRWAKTKNVAATSALFILVNSCMGLAGFVSSGKPVPSLVWLLAGTAIAGGTLGSYLGSRRFPVRTIQLLLAVVLVIAGAKLVFGG
jgi:uncharacterized membrane protein YfcA